MKAVILAGGLGTRLKPFTEIIPKPLLPIGESSVLEIQIRNLSASGFNDVFIATNYMSEYIKAYLGNGSKYGVTLTFSTETQPMGTCGPLTLLKEHLQEPFLLMNGDILTNLNFNRAYKASKKIDASLVVVTKEILLPFNFGKVICKDNFIVEVQEKPNFKHEILSGIYFMHPDIFRFIPEDTYYGIDSLIMDMLRKGEKIGRYLMKEYWLDIGQFTDYQDAQEAYKKHFGQQQHL
ncbi:NTP transferase domain-containing protein [bacterium]|nr:NTP transferase domain-containing protein [bacterium]